jgi:hypothetical protein
MSRALLEAITKVKVGKLYYHYKDPKKYYRVICLAINEANHETMVVYTSHDQYQISWVRSVNQWTELVDGVPRFSLVE